MESIRLYVLPAVLVTVGLIQALLEARSFRCEPEPDRRRRTRFGRRLATSLLLVGVGVLLHLGKDITPVGGNPAEVVRQFYYWVAVLGLVLLVGCLAAWDAFDALHGLAHQIEHVEKAELESLREQLQRGVHRRKKR